MAQCEVVAHCSEEPGCITRRCLTEPMQQVHRELSGWMREAGLDTRCDSAGNLIGRRHSLAAKQTLLVGSHLDSVPGAGRYDGVLGVLMSLAVSKALASTPLPFHLDVIGFSEEEGVRFNKPYLGSSAVAGCFQDNWLERVDPNGVSLREALVAFGGDPDRIADAAYPAEQVIGYVEPHLEQGPVLERTGLPVGVVSGIAGQSRLRLEFCGEAGHAGTTPMAGRRDALVAAAALISSVRATSRTHNGLLATVGRIESFPNAPNVIPDRVELSLDVRHLENPIRELAVHTILNDAENIASADGCQFTVIEHTSHAAVAVDKNLTQLMADAVADCGFEPRQVPSGAGHDAVIMSQRFPVAMLFVRHPGAVSHHPDERVDLEDVATGIDTLTRFILRVARHSQSFASASAHL